MTESKTPLRFFSWSLTRYVVKDVLISFVVGTVIFLLILLMFQVLRLSEFVVVHQVPLKDIARLSAYLLLSFVPIALPVAFLFAVLMEVSRANSEGEMLALQVNGLSLGRIFFPLGVLSLFICGICLYTALFLVPKGNRKFELLITQLGNERVMAALKPGVFLQGFYGLVLFAEQIIPVRNEMQRVFIYDERDEKHPLAVTAQAGILRLLPEREILTLRLTNGSIHLEKKQRDPIQQKIDFELYDINLNTPSRAESWREYSPPSYNYPQLKARLLETKHDIPANRQLLIELHRRFSLSFSCIVFAALGFFIGTLSQRGIRSTAVILCVLVGVAYWLSFVAANALALAGWVLPWFGVWVPNLVFGLIAYACYRWRLKR